MFFREISRFLSRFLFYFTLVLCVPVVISLAYEFFLEPNVYARFHNSLAFSLTLLICLSLALIFWRLSKGSVGKLYRRESILLVAIVWLVTTGISALPFTFTGSLKPVDAYFEAMSGLTTTGSTGLYPKAYDPVTGQEIPVTIKSGHEPGVSYTFYGTVEPLRDQKTGKILYTGVEALGKPLLFWRSFLQWLGGMGIVVLFIAVFPALAMGGRFLFETEVTGPSKEAMTPRVQETASMLWKIYLSLTIAQIILLLVTNREMPFFDAVTLSLCTISTGGFSVRNDSFGTYHNGNTEWVVILFMILGALNFSLYFHALRRKFYRLLDTEFFIYLATLAGGVFLMTWTLWNTPKILFSTAGGTFSFFDALRYGSFQAISAQTSTGYAIADYDLWPASSQVLLVLLMFVGGMAGSTSGGIKIARHCILFRVIAQKIESLFRPETVRVLKLGKKEISSNAATTALVFLCVLTLLTVLGTLLYVFDGVDPQAALGLTTCFINNAGLSFGPAGPTQSCAFLSDFSKIISILWMLLGRLEFFALLVFLVPAFWRNK